MIVALCLAALSAGEARAHAALLNAIPGAGQVFDTGPTEIRIEFSTEVDLAEVELHVADASGAELKLLAPESGPAFGALVVRRFVDTPTRGDYTVRWRVFSVDGHWTRGDYAFHVGGE